MKRITAMTFGNILVWSKGPQWSLSESPGSVCLEVWIPLREELGSIALRIHSLGFTISVDWKPFVAIPAVIQIH